MPPEIVMKHVERVMSMRWEWGKRDCCTAAADVFLGLHGIDPMARVRGRYDSAVSAARLIREWGGFSSMVEAFARISHLEVGQGEPGEIGLSAPGDAGGPDRRALLICVKPGLWAGKTELGFATLPNAERSWRA